MEPTAYTESSTSGRPLKESSWFQRSTPVSMQTCLARCLTISTSPASSAASSSRTVSVLLPAHHTTQDARCSNGSDNPHRRRLPDRSIVPSCSPGGTNVIQMVPSAYSRLYPKWYFDRSTCFLHSQWRFTLQGTGAQTPQNPG